jgi:hypothetical protein
MKLDKMKLCLLAAAIMAGLCGTPALAMDEFQVAPPEIPNRTLQLA